jgi:alkylhydroperoxidase family enzyme|tara:strand:+ start:10894 stop:11046 length:153 start_codon:yes stop_codon:yes gene_type:complete
VVSEETYERARAHFDEAQLVALAATVAMENYRARFNRVFEVESMALYAAD